MVTQRLLINDSITPSFRPHSTPLFRPLKAHKILGGHIVAISSDYGLEILTLTCPEQMKRLKALNVMIPTYSLNIDAPLFHTYQWRKPDHSPFFWMLRTTIKVLEYLQPDEPLSESTPV